MCPPTHHIPPGGGKGGACKLIMVYPCGKEVQVRKMPPLVVECCCDALICNYVCQTAMTTSCSNFTKRGPTRFHIGTRICLPCGRRRCLGIT